jgi:hypothetical protein
MKINENFIRKTFYITEETSKEIANLKKITGNTITLIVNNAIQAYEQLTVENVDNEDLTKKSDIMVLTKQIRFTEEYKRATFYIKNENWSLIEKLVDERNEKITVVFNEMLELYLTHVKY